MVIGGLCVMTDGQPLTLMWPVDSLAILDLVGNFASLPTVTVATLFSILLYRCNYLQQCKPTKCKCHINSSQ